MVDATTILELRAEGGEAAARSVLGVHNTLKGTQKTILTMQSNGGLGAALLGSRKNNFLTFAERAKASLDDFEAKLESLREAQTQALSAKEWIAYNEQIKIGERKLNLLRQAAAGVADETERAARAGRDIDPDTGRRYTTPEIISSSVSGVGAYTAKFDADVPKKISDAVQSVKDFADGTQEFVDAADDAGPVIDRVKSVINATTAAYVASGGGAKGAAVGVTAFVTSLGPLVLVAAAVTLAISAITSALQAQAEQRQKEIDDTRAMSDTLSEWERLVASGATEEELRAHIEGVENQIDSLGGKTAEYGAILATVQAAQEEAAQADQAVIHNLSAGSGALAVAVANAAQAHFRLNAQTAQSTADLMDASDGAYTSLEGMAAIIEEDTKEADRLSTALGVMQGDMKGGALAEARRAAALREVENAEEELASVREQAAQATDQFAQSLRDYAERNRRETVSITERNRREDELALREHTRNLRRITDDGYKRINDAVADFMKQTARDAADFVKNETKAQIEYDKQAAKEAAAVEKEIGKARESFMKSEIEATENYAKEVEKADKENAKERLRRLRDLGATLQEAELNNDIVSFINAQRAFEKEEREASAQAKEQADERKAQWAEERQASREALDAQIADIRENAREARAESLALFAEQKAERRAQFDEEQAEKYAAHVENLAGLKAQWAEERQAAIDAFALAAADTKEAREYEREQRKAALAQELTDMTAAHKKQLDAYQKREDQMLAVIQSGGSVAVSAFKTSVIVPVVDMINSVPRMINSLAGQMQAAMSGYTMKGGYTGSFGTGKTTISFGNVNLAGVSQSQFNTQMTSLQKSIVAAVSYAKSGVRVPTY